jgi:hypothetical protein
MSLSGLDLLLAAELDPLLRTVADTAARYLLRDRDRIFGDEFVAYVLKLDAPER